MENCTGRANWEAYLNKEASEHIEWLIDMSQEQRQLLKKYLLNIDGAYRVDLDSERSRNVRKGICEIVNKIGQMIAERKPELKGRIIPKGSAHNGTKIGDSDEFDFVYEMDSDNFLNGKGTAKSVLGNHLSIDLLPGADVCIPATKPSHCVFQTYVCKRIHYEEGWGLNTFTIKLLFRKALKEVLSELELPPGWCHGGFNRPHFSGLRFHGPSHVLQFDYLATSDKTPLRISVDFVPIIKVQPICGGPKPEPLEACLYGEIPLQYGWLTLINNNNKGNYYGPAEDMWLSTFPTLSTSKTLIRITKVLNRLVKTSATKYPGKLDVSKIDSYIRDTTTGRGGPCTLQLTVLKRDGFVHVQDDFVSYSDLNETTGEDSILKSYFMKRLVLGMMFADKESQGRDWTDDDLPDLVISVYMFLQKKLMRPNLTWPKSVIKERTNLKPKTLSIKLFTEEFSVHLKEMHGQREEKRQGLHEGEDDSSNCMEDISQFSEHGKNVEDLAVSQHFKETKFITKPDAAKFCNLLWKSELKHCSKIAYLSKDWMVIAS